MHWNNTNDALPGLSEGNVSSPVLLLKVRSSAGKISCITGYLCKTKYNNLEWRSVSIDKTGGYLISEDIEIMKWSHLPDDDDEET